MTYTATRQSPTHAWIITASDGHKVIALPYDTYSLVAKAIAAAFTAEAKRIAR